MLSKLQPTQLKFRQAQRSDVGVAVSLILSSGPKAFDYAFLKAKEFVNYAFLDGSGLFGWGNHTVALLGDEVAGIGAFYGGSDYALLKQSLLRQVISFYKLRQLPRVFWRMRRLAVLMPAPDRGTLYVANLGVVSSRQGQGIGSALLLYHAAIGSALGRRVLALDVADDNPRAESLYARLGFVVTSVQHFPGPSGMVPNTKRMVMDLQRFHSTPK